MTEDKLDRSKSFGIVYGHPELGFVQAGRYFRHDGTLKADAHSPPPDPGQRSHTLKLKRNESDPHD